MPPPAEVLKDTILQLQASRSRVAQLERELKALEPARKLTVAFKWVALVACHLPCVLSAAVSQPWAAQLCRGQSPAALAVAVFAFTWLACSLLGLLPPVRSLCGAYMAHFGLGRPGATSQVARCDRNYIADVTKALCMCIAILAIATPWR